MTDIVDVSAELQHIGTKRHSGRYPWGSGEDPYQGSSSIMGQIAELRGRGMSDAAISRALGMESTTELRAEIAIADNAARAERQATAKALKEKGMSTTAIGKQMGLNESTVRSLLDPARQEKTNIMMNTANFLKEKVDSGKLIDIGLGTEAELGISGTKLAVAVAVLKKQGYTVHDVWQEQVGNPGQFTTRKTLCPPGMTLGEAFKNRDKIELVQGYSENGGRDFKLIQTPRSISSKQLDIVYGKDGGSQMDGVIELRRGVPELSLEGKRYAQVRIAVDDTHYIKGMAIYADDLPAGKNLRFNTNKEDTGNPLDALKPIKGEEGNPFGSVVRQRTYIDKDGKEKLSAINIVGSKPGSYEEGGWEAWSKRISSQMLSKQSPQLAKQQLDLTSKSMKADLDEIKKLTNPAVKKKLLESFADSCDSDAAKLVAAALPRQTNKVLLPSRYIKENEVYAPTYKTGEKVVLIRHPHGGTFEIPELTVAKPPRVKKLWGDIQDAVVINHKVAARLSGADFDGDTVLVIPNNAGKIKTSKPLKELEGFDTISAYPGYPGMKKISPKNKQREMGIASNLITDMTVKGAPRSELARAVKYSMVVIDAEKHGLDYRTAYKKNGIDQLKQKYQAKPDGGAGGASTIISRANGGVYIPQRAPRKYPEGPIDKVTGEKVYTPTGKLTTRVLRDKDKNIVRDESGKAIKIQGGLKMEEVPRMSLVKDANKLVSDHNNDIETIYAAHANRLKALANEARLVSTTVPPVKKNPSAAKAYSQEVASLTAKKNLALKAKPLERQAQTIASLEVAAKRQAQPMDKDTLKKAQTLALAKARARMSTTKAKIDITPKEWEAIQAGALSNHNLSEILRYTDEKTIKEYATPRTKLLLPTSKVALAKAMQNRGYLQSEIAAQLGVSESLLSKTLNA